MKEIGGIEAKPIKELLDLKRHKVRLEQLYLDPNNPRLGIAGNTPENRILEDTVQQSTQRKIEEIGINDLISTVQRYGFVATDPVVVRKLRGDKYVVVEGNRRITTLKMLVDSHKKGEITFDKELFNSMTNLEVLLYEGNDPDIAWVVQGLRHMSGIKQWTPLQQAKFIAKIEQTIGKRTRKKRGRPPGIPTVAKTAGVTTAVANRLLRSYYGFQQARKDDDYGEVVTEDKFSMFSEAVFRGDDLQKWVEWSDERRRFQNTENFKKLLMWISPSEDGGEPKIVRAVDARDVLPDIVSNADLLRRFEKGSLDINQARVEIMQSRPKHEPDLDSLKERLNEFLNVLDTLPLPKIQREKRKEEFKLLLQNLKASIEYQINNVG